MITYHVEAIEPYTDVTDGDGLMIVVREDNYQDHSTFETHDIYITKAQLKDILKGAL